VQAEQKNATRTGNSSTYRNVGMPLPCSRFHGSACVQKLAGYIVGAQLMFCFTRSKYFLAGQTNRQHPCVAIGTLLKCGSQALYTAHSCAWAMDRRRKIYPVVFALYQKILSTHNLTTP
jgi:hypothetical protein